MYYQNPDFEPTEGFWREFFLLPPDCHELSRVIDGLTPDGVLQIQVRILEGDYGLLIQDRCTDFLR